MIIGAKLIMFYRTVKLLPLKLLLHEIEYFFIKMYFYVKKQQQTPK